MELLVDHPAAVERMVLPQMAVLCSRPSSLDPAQLRIVRSKIVADRRIRSATTYRIGAAFPIDVIIAFLLEIRGIVQLSMDSLRPRNDVLGLCAGRSPHNFQRVGPYLSPQRYYAETS